MKKVLFYGLALGLSITLTSATSVEKNTEEDFGRQCCTKTTYLSDGSSVSITACAGSFLSNDANAMTRACKKVDEAMGIQ
ncbi:hypothetical protein ACFQ1M_01215 [Sungkyunkwania multivorans]|uniref:Uncharacterized protein n=1 Tax=Sungkyunkwania multivorans TaxID=1173618 RepID=A0ABW3CSR7_9FLAO